MYISRSLVEIKKVRWSTPLIQAAPERQTYVQVRMIRPNAKSSYYWLTGPYTWEHLRSNADVVCQVARRVHGPVL